MVYEKQKTKNISFPLGGIGTGCIGLGGNGELKDWEIFNRPNKNTRNGYSHFAIKASCGGKSVTKVLQGDTVENLTGTSCASGSYYGFGFGPRESSMAGFPHFKNVSFDGTFPVAKLTFSDNDFPAEVRLCAFNPFIPHDEFNSSLPAAFFEWEVENTGNEEIKITLACTVFNPADKGLNSAVQEENARGVFLKSAGVDKNKPDYSDLCILTDSCGADVQEYWYRGGWKDGCTTYWKNLSNLDRLPLRHYDEHAWGDHATVASYASLAPGKKTKFRFIISWNVPVLQNYWTKDRERAALTWRNYYATQFESSLHTAKYSLERFDSLYEKTALLASTLESCTLDKSVKDAICANLSVIKTPTALRLEDGSFWGWEGCFETGGSCHGTCQHVWNYAYVMPYLFPRLERSMRENTIKYALMDNGATSFRIDLPLKKEMNTARACVDGQMGEVIKCYREWKLSGDDAWLKENSDSIFKMLEYAWADTNPDKWDADMDGVLEGRQHHTLDMELFGASSWLQGFYLLALDCGAKMARYLGERSRAELYERLYKSGKEWTNTHLFNGKYFCHKINLSDKAVLDRFDAARDYWNEEAGEIKYQVAQGCIIDQMLADWHAVLLGIDGVFDTEKKKTALESLYKNNFKASMRSVTNMWRLFSLDDEAGTIICSYPDGVMTPAIPIPYCEETMTGFEYALAGLMIAEGFVNEGEEMVKAIRDRYDGEKRNPWNEIECGSNYARSMASFALMPIYSGFTFDMTDRHVGFNPISKTGKYMFSVCQSWGSVELDERSARIAILGEPLVLRSLLVPCCGTATSVCVDGKEIDFKLSDGRLVFEDIKICSELRVR